MKHHPIVIVLFCMSMVSCKKENAPNYKLIVRDYSTKETIPDCRVYSPSVLTGRQLLGRSNSDGAFMYKGTYCEPFVLIHPGYFLGDPNEMFAENISIGTECVNFLIRKDTIVIHFFMNGNDFTQLDNHISAKSSTILKNSGEVPFLDYPENENLTIFTAQGLYRRISVYRGMENKIVFRRVPSNTEIHSVRITPSEVSDDTLYIRL